MSAHTCPTSVAGSSSWGFVGVTQQQVDAYPMAKTGRFPITGYESDGSPIVDQESGYPMDEMAYTDFVYPAWGGAASYKLNTVKMCTEKRSAFLCNSFL